MYKSILHKSKILILLSLLLLGLAACDQAAPVEEAVSEEGSVVKIAPGAYDSADTAIVVAKDEKQKTITFYNLIKKKNYTLNYDGATLFLDKYGSQISVSQLSEGEMVDLNFLKEKKLLANLQASLAGWTFDDVSKFELDLANGKIEILDEFYNIDENTVILSEGKRVELMDINAQDILQVKGIDHDIYSITIQKGHGYLRLANDEYFIGGWIEVGQKLIQKIEEDMLLVVPEGTYDVHLSHSGIEGTKEVEIKRNQETQLDVGDLKKEDMVKYGNLIFTVEPSTASVYLDGKSIDIARTVKIEYGLHQIMAKAEGYDTVIQYIKVSQNSANVAITLDEETERSVSSNSTKSETTKSDTTSVSGNTDSSSNSSNQNSSSNSSSDSSDSKKEESISGNNKGTDSGSTTGYKVTIESPAGAEVYVDGNYVGIIPASFTKKEGSHVITIRKTGYLTRSYTIEVDNEAKDVSYSFSDLSVIE